MEYKSECIEEDEYFCYIIRVPKNGTSASLNDAGENEADCSHSAGTTFPALENELNDTRCPHFKFPGKCKRCNPDKWFCNVCMKQYAGELALQRHIRKFH